MLHQCFCCVAMRLLYEAEDWPRQAFEDTHATKHTTRQAMAASGCVICCAAVTWLASPGSHTWAASSRGSMQSHANWCLSSRMQEWVQCSEAPDHERCIAVSCLCVGYGGFLHAQNFSQPWDHKDMSPAWHIHFTPQDTNPALSKHARLQSQARRASQR